MKRKKWLIPILTLVLLVQILAPVGLIVYHKNIDLNLHQKGEKYLFAIQIYYIGNGMVNYNFTDFHVGALGKSPAYFVIYTDENGVACLDKPIHEKPSEGTPYIRCTDTESFPYERTYETGDTDLMYVKTGGIFHSDENIDLVALKNWFLEVSVYKGNYAVLGIVDENGTPCEQALKELL